MSQEKGPEDRRRQRRVKVGGGLVAKVQTVLQAPIIDLSATGALVEVEEVLRPGARCTVRLPVSEEQTLRLSARVVRSTLVALGRGGDARAAIYRAAVEFVDVADEDRAALCTYLDHLDGAVSAEISPEPSGGK